MYLNSAMRSSFNVCGVRSLATLTGGKDEETLFVQRRRGRQLVDPRPGNPRGRLDEVGSSILEAPPCEIRASNVYNQLIIRRRNPLKMSSHHIP